LCVLGSFGRGGAESFVLELLGKHDKENFKWAVCGLHQPLNESLLEEFRKLDIDCYDLDIPAWSLKKKPFSSLVRIWSLYRRFKKVVRDFKPDIIHAHMLLPSVLTQLFFPFSRIKLFTTYHNTEFATGKHKLIVRKLTQKIARPMCIACSDEVKKVITEQGFAPKDNCLVVRTGVDIDKYNPERVNADIETEFDRNPGRVHILQIGRMVAQKGHKYTIEALRLLKDEGIDVFVFAAGMGPKKEELVELAKEKGVSENIVFSRVSEEEKMKLLKTADIYIMPSLHEGLSLAMLEAMSMGLAMIASSVGGAAEVIEDGKSGFLIPPRDAESLAEKISFLAGNSRLREKLGENARERVVRDYSLQSRSRQLEDLYRGIIKSKGKAKPPINTNEL